MSRETLSDDLDRGVEVEPQLLLGKELSSHPVSRTIRKSLFVEPVVPPQQISGTSNLKSWTANASVPPIAVYIT